MGIDVFLQTEDGEELAACLDPQARLPNLLGRLDLSRTCCLRFIDPHGDTTFNRAQVAVLRQELAAVRPKVDATTLEFIDKVIGLAEGVESDVHLYLKFVGD